MKKMKKIKKKQDENPKKIRDYYEEKRPYNRQKMNKLELENYMLRDSKIFIDDR